MTVAMKIVIEKSGVCVSWKVPSPKRWDVDSELGNLLIKGYYRKSFEIIWIRNDLLGLSCFPSANQDRYKV